MCCHCLITLNVIAPQTYPDLPTVAFYSQLLFTCSCCKHQQSEAGLRGARHTITYQSTRETLAEATNQDRGHRALHSPCKLWPSGGKAIACLRNSQFISYMSQYLARSSRLYVCYYNVIIILILSVTLGLGIIAVFLSSIPFYHYCQPSNSLIHVPI